MPIEGDYLGMRLVVGEDDPPNYAFFQSVSYTHLTLPTIA